jgi:hypothetical protein
LKRRNGSSFSSSAIYWKYITHLSSIQFILSICSYSRTPPFSFCVQHRILPLWYLQWITSMRISSRQSETWSIHRPFVLHWHWEKLVSTNTMTWVINPRSTV